MKVIRPGKPMPDYRGTCKECGCEFECTHSESTHEYGIVSWQRNRTTYGYGVSDPVYDRIHYAECPYCNANVIVSPIESKATITPEETRNIELARLVEAKDNALANQKYADAAELIRAIRKITKD